MSSPMHSTSSAEVGRIDVGPALTHRREPILEDDLVILSG
jgi:hypothetical protein